MTPTQNRIIAGLVKSERFPRVFQCGMLERHGEGFETSPAPNRNASYGDCIMASRAIRPIRVEGNIAYVPLTKGYEAVIDAADVPMVDGFNWFAHVQDAIVYAVRNSRRGDPRKRGEIRMHRVLLGAPVGLLVDHRDGDGLNNRRNNLRTATDSQNAQNTRIRRDNTTGYKGVTRSKSFGKWEARIKVLGRRRHLGTFNCATAAHFAYTRAGLELHGDFHRPAFNGAPT